MTPMIWVICCADLAMPSIAATACLTTTAPFFASPSAAATTSRACSADSAAFFTVSVISPSAAAVSSSVAACCSVRRDRSSEACATASALTRMPRTESEMTAMARCIWAMASLKSSFTF